MGIITVAAIVVFGIGLVAEIFDNYGDGRTAGIGLTLGIVVFLVGHMFCLMSYNRTFTYENRPIEFQEVEGEYFTPQGNEYVVKMEGEIKIYPKNKFYTVQSDSIYDEVQIGIGISNHSNFDKWMVGKQVSDTTKHISKFILHRQLNVKK